MRFSVLHLLLVGTAFAAPIHDIEHATKRSDTEGLIGRGLVPVFPRNPVPAIIVAPKVVPKPVVKPKPVPNTPDAPVVPGGPIPHDPSVPITPDTPALRPNEPTSPKTPADTEHPGLIPADDATTPAKTPEDSTPGVVPNDDTPADLSSDGCLLKRCVRSEPPELTVNDRSRWKVNKVEETRKKGYNAHKDLDDIVTAGAADKGFKGNLNTNNKYNAQRQEYTGDMGGKYFLDERFKDLKFKEGEKWPESTVRNSDDQVRQFEEWRNAKMGELTDDDLFNFKDKVPEDGGDAVMLRTHENPAKGAMIIKESFNERNDYYRSYKYTMPRDGAELPKEYTRPAFTSNGNSAPTRWTDQTMANWRQAVAATPGADVKNLKYMARDNIITTHTTKVLEGVLEQMGPQGAQRGQMFTVRRTGGNAAETASFDAIAGTVHGQRPIQMLADHHVELGDLKVNAFHVLVEPVGSTTMNHYHMVIEMGH
ncbi:hypothetical protein K458DRAFT_413229 [Lentithecium fluviatile CBS 122367]|uniref:ADP-ribosylation n=1 Tax=Lentithecium fluviatile CBS 122367 TaxID=1168545 RepID=A0A6G1JIS5_9PLEO|nr:hypothetical protein K458DRAFT_413229 [Lentithecium fluviatile CBS 122367]